MKKKKKKAGVADEEQKKKRHSEQKCMKRHKKGASRKSIWQKEVRKQKQMKKDRDSQKYIKRQLCINPNWNPLKGKYKDALINFKAKKNAEESKKNAEESKKVNAEESKKPKELATAEESKVNAEDHAQLLMRELHEQKKKLDSTDTVARKADACSQTNTSTIDKHVQSSRECFRRLGHEVEKAKALALHNKERLDARDVHTGHKTPTRRTRGYHGR